MTSEIEIERKFLVESRPAWLDKCDSDRIDQGYLARDGDVEVRVRRYGPSTVLTIKSGRGLDRGEIEIGITDDQFAGLWRFTEGRRLTKHRYRRHADVGTFEIDLYEGELDGLMTAEIEFESEETSRELVPPHWLGEEVTGDERYFNFTLAVHGLPGGG